MSVSAKHYDLSQIYCHKYKAKLTELNSFELSFSLTKKESKQHENFNLLGNSEFSNKIDVNTSASSRFLSSEWNWCIFYLIVLKSKFLNIMNALVEIKLTQYLNEGQMLRKRMKQLNLLSRPTRNRKLSEHLCLLKPPYFRDLPRISN